MNSPLNMHTARMALNQDATLRQWAEAWLKEKERGDNPTMSDEEFEKHWLYVRPERMHEGAIEAVAAYKSVTRNTKVAEVWLTLHGPRHFPFDKSSYE